MANDEEIKLFRDMLKEQGTQLTHTRLMQNAYGTKDSWKYKLAEDFIRQEENKVKHDIEIKKIEQSEIGNQLKLQSNKIAWIALVLSSIALFISIISIFK